jgi:hypothetical protein
MKIKKSQLIQLIKEEIMAEAEMFKMSPEDLADFSQPDMANMAFSKLMDKMRSGGPPYAPMQEGMEGINPENMQLVADALQKMAPLIGVMSLPVLVGIIFEQLKSMGAK